jgi:hypothetical protein
MFFLIILIITYKSDNREDKFININRVINKAIINSYLLS